jgi:hypothetical protein
MISKSERGREYHTATKRGWEDKQQCEKRARQMELTSRSMMPTELLHPSKTDEFERAACPSSCLQPPHAGNARGLTFSELVRRQPTSAIRPATRTFRWAITLSGKGSEREQAGRLERRQQHKSYPRAGRRLARFALLAVLGVRLSLCERTREVKTRGAMQTRIPTAASAKRLRLSYTTSGD